MDAVICQSFFKYVILNIVAFSMISMPLAMDPFTTEEGFGSLLAPSTFIRLPQMYKTSNVMVVHEFQSELNIKCPHALCGLVNFNLFLGGPFFQSLTFT